jgi:hypothetical protein
MPMGFRLLEQEAEPTAIDRIFQPEGVRKNARDVGLVGAIQEAAGGMGQDLIGPDDEPSQILLEMSHLILVVPQVAETCCVHGDHGSRHSHRPFHPTSPVLGRGFGLVQE